MKTALGSKLRVTGALLALRDRKVHNDRKGYRGLQVHQVPQLAVYDVNGTFVGSVVGIDGTAGIPIRPYIGLSVNDVAFVLGVFGNRFQGTHSQVHFESNNCSGSPFLPPTEQPIPAAVMVNNVAYVADHQVAIVNVTIGSLLNVNGSCILGRSR